MNWRRARDLGLLAGLGLLVLAETGARDDPFWVRGLFLAVVLAGVALRRRWPIAALGVLIGAQVVVLAITLNTSLGTPISLVPAVVLFSYFAGRQESQLRHFVILCSWSLLGLLVLGLALRRDVAVTEAVLTWFIMLLLGLLFAVLPWLIGRYRAQRALLVMAGWERAERVEREHQLEVDQVRLRERSRIAQDMHDSVGHELSLIALRAGALELDPDLPPQHQQAAADLREAAAAATDRLGEIIGVLREAEAKASVVPAQETVAQLVDRAAASGLQVRLEEDEPNELTALVDRAVHRVVQESLTNASKHAPGAEVAVSFTYPGDDVQVRITNTGSTRLDWARAASTGQGLAGLTERVRLVGGTISAGPRPDGGFEVLAKMPRAGGPPEPNEPPVSAAAVELANARRSVRRGLIVAAVAPAVLGLAIGLIALGYYLLVGYSSILPPRTYDGLQVGQPAAEVKRQLPAMQMVDPPDELYQPPAGWDCQYYRPDGPFSITYVYRLCFSGGALVRKDVVQTGSVPPTPEGTP